jgi:hypothetical protein
MELHRRFLSQQRNVTEYDRIQWKGVEHGRRIKNILLKYMTSLGGVMPSVSSETIETKVIHT